MTELREHVAAWAAEQPDVVAVVLVGSHARGEARPDSDIDLVLVTTDRGGRLRERGWLARFGQVLSVEEADYGAIRSLHVQYAFGEVEWALGETTWLEMTRTDPGTRAVVARGYRVWFAREALGALG